MLRQNCKEAGVQRIADDGERPGARGDPVVTATLTVGE